MFSWFLHLWQRITEIFIRNFRFLEVWQRITEIFIRNFRFLEVCQRITEIFIRNFRVFEIWQRITEILIRNFRFLEGWQRITEIFTRKNLLDFSFESMMDISMVHQDSTLDEASREPDGNACADNSILQNPDRRNSNVVPNTSCGVPPSTKDEIMALGYPSDGDIFEGYCYVNSFNFDCGVSRWVSECLTRKQVKKNCASRRKGEKSFYEDEEIDVERRVTLDDYKNSDYQKGHLAAAGNHNYSFQAYERTFCLRNIAPMYRNTNIILNKIEKQAQKFAEEKGKVHIITGTVFRDAEKEPIFVKEGSKVRVPDAFFKVLVHDDTHKKHNIHRVFAYMVENKPDGHEDIEKALKDIKNARVNLEFINRVTGLKILGEIDKRKLIDDCNRKQKTSRGIGS